MLSGAAVRAGDGEGAQASPVANFIVGEPGTFHDLDLLGGAVLADGVCVG